MTPRRAPQVMVEVVLEIDDDPAPSGPFEPIAPAGRPGTGPGWGAPRSGADADVEDAGWADAGDAEPGAHTRRDTAAEHRAARRATRHRRRTVAGIAAAAVLVAGVNVVEAAREQRRNELLAALPGTVAGLAEPLTVSWETTVVPTDGIAHDLVISAEGAGRLGELVAIDVATGERRWSVPRGSSGTADWCEGGIGTLEEPLVLCWRNASVLPGVVGAEAFVSPRLVVLDAADGSIVAEHVRDVPAAGHGVVDGDLVAATRDGSSVRVVRLDPVTLEERWSVDLPLVAQLVDGSFSAFLRVDDHGVVLTGPTTVVLDADDGSTLAEWHVDPDAPGVSTWVTTQILTGADVVTTDRGFAAWDQVVDGVRGPVGRWYAPDGTPGPAIEGFLAEPEVTDGSAPDVVLLRDAAGTELSGVDVTTGEVRWTVEMGTHVLLRREGEVVVAEVDGLRALDLTSGEERWRVVTPGLDPAVGTVTDGRQVVVAVRDGGRWVLQAVELDDGRTIWTAAAPPWFAPEDSPPTLGATVLGEVAGHVLIGRGGILVGLA